jgi:hypothetical protein
VDWRFPPAVHGPTDPRCLQIGLLGMHLLNFKLQAPVKFKTLRTAPTVFYKM